VSPTTGQITYALLTRPPLGPKAPFDLHVLSTPPAFVLSQDQTLRKEFSAIRFILADFRLASSVEHLAYRSTPRCPPCGRARNSTHAEPVAVTKVKRCSRIFLVPPAVTLGNDLLPASFAHPPKGDQAELAKNIIQASSLQATGISSYPVVKVPGRSAGSLPDHSLTLPELHLDCQTA